MSWQKTLHHPLKHLPVVLLFAFLLSVELSSLDFGQHWDEHWSLKSAQASAENGILLPQSYLYAGACYWACLVCMLPTLLRALWAGQRSEQIHELLSTFTQSPDFVLEARGVCATLSMLAIFWIYGFVLALERSRWQALLAATLYGLSWEVAYHARFVAPDAIAVQFSVLSLFALARYRAAPSIWSLRWSAAAAGLGASTKYPYGIPLLSIAILLWHFRERNKGFLAPLLSAAFWFTFAYLAVTPGTILAPETFYRSLNTQWGVYTTGWGISTVRPGLHHAQVVAEYLFLSGLSSYSWIALAGSILAFIGALRLAICDWRWGVVYFSSLLGYLGFFFAMSAMNARNYLFAFPFLAILAAEGLNVVWNIRPGRQGVRAACVLLVCGLVFLNASWLISSAESIRAKKSTDVVLEALDFARTHPGESFVLSSGLAQEQEQRNLTLPSNVQLRPPRDGEFVLFFPGDVPSTDYFPANHHDLVPHWFGSHEINFNYYPAWPHIMGGRWVWEMRSRDIAGMNISFPPAPETSHLKAENPSGVINFKHAGNSKRLSPVAEMIPETP